ncbi:MAG: Fe-S cluster assembly sulfur transfer protein SufU [Rhodanobacteraceae bacterium]
MTAPALYQQLVLEHYRNPRNRGALPECTHAADGVNPLCGDSLRIEVACRHGRIQSMRFSGESCAITTATASMLSELAQGRDADEIAALNVPFDEVVRGARDADASLGDLNALGELRRHPARRKCAELPWATLRAALAGTARVTTEHA